jgi:putative SbcD/Mre11-related phosphoesterase
MKMKIQLIHNEPALLIEEKPRRILVVADLHLGYERVLFKKERFSTKLSEGLAKHLQQLVTKINPTEIIILGDLKHSIRNFSLSEFREVASLLRKLTEVAQLFVIRGNHDADLELVIPDETTLIPSSGMHLDFSTTRLYLTHGHAQPTESLLESDLLIMGHIHPMIAIPTIQDRFSTRRVWVKTRWKTSFLETLHRWFEPTKIQQAIEKNQIEQMRIIIMPAFLDLLQGHTLNRDKTAPKLGIPLFQHLDLNAAEIILLDQTLLGQLKDLKIKSNSKTEENL